VKLLYTHPNRILVDNARNIVENAGIPTELRNEFAGGGVGELAPIGTWLELWVRTRDLERARAVLDAVFASEAEDDWVCPACGELNSGSFEFCWHCHALPSGQKDPSN
jgi:hypothetical protein